MKNYICLIALLSSVLPLAGQSFEECSIVYHNAYNKIQFQRFQNQIDKDSAYSLILAINQNLDNCLIGNELPDYTFKSRFGRTFTKESLRGKVVLFNFWSLRCGPCILEIPVLNKIYLRYKDNEDFVLISILLEKEDELENFLNNGLTKKRIAYEVVPDSKAILKDTFKSIKGYPTNLFLDRDGRLFEKTVGAIADPKDEHKLEAKLMSIIDKELYKDKENK